MKLDDLIEIFKSNGYRITEQRKAILTVLNKYKNNFISVDKLFKNAKELCSKTNMSTVYRNLEILEKLHLIHKIINDDSISMYQMKCIDEHHHHIICKCCGKTETIDYCPITQLKHITNNKKFILTDHKLELYGYCEKCNE